MGTRGGGGTLCCAETAVMGGGHGGGRSSFPHPRAGAVGCAHTARGFGVPGRQWDPDVGFRARIPLRAVEKQAVPGWDSAHFLGAESPHAALTWPQHPACGGCTGCAELPSLAAHVGTTVYPQCHSGVYPATIGHPLQQRPSRSAGSCIAAPSLPGARPELQSEVCREAQASPPLPTLLMARISLGKKLNSEYQRGAAIP